MKSSQKIDCKILVLFVVFVISLVLTLVLFYQQTVGVDKKALGTEVYVKIIDIQTPTGLMSGTLDVMVSYQGETYKLHGVSDSARSVMEKSLTQNQAVSVSLYNGELYYDSSGITATPDIVCYACLTSTFLSMGLMFLRIKDKV